jgi:hypothetical protein
MIPISKGIQPKPVKGLIYGPEGVGKSSLAAQFPNPLFIDVEGGTGQLDVARTPRPQAWPQFLQYIKTLAQDPMDFETLVIDTADWLERIAIAQVCAENGLSGLGGNNDYGHSYNRLADMWTQLLTQLSADFIEPGRLHVVFLAHSVTKKFELPEEMGQYDRYQLKLEKKVAPLLMEWADLILFVNYQTVVVRDEKTKSVKAQGGVRRMMHAEHCAAFDAKNRFGLPREMELGFDPIRRCFCALMRVEAAPVTTPAPTPPPVATPDPEPVAKQAPVSPQCPTPQHAALAAMMAEAGVTYEEVLSVLVARGHYPEGTPFENIAPEFIGGWINKFWPNVLEFIAKGKAKTEAKPEAENAVA